MAHGYPDYAPVAGEALGGKGYLTYVMYGAGEVSAGASGTIDFGEVTEDYEIYQAVGIASAKGCDTAHACMLYANDTIYRVDYFEVLSTIAYPRHYIAKSGETMKVVFYNWDAVARYFSWSAVGIILDLGTRPLNPQRELGAKPKLKKDEKLWLINDTLFGKRWLKVKQEKIMEIPEAIYKHIEGLKGV